jgi:hypothetical protein
MENSKSQIIFINGGDAFRDTEKLYAMLRQRSFNPYEVKKKWREELIKNLESDFECHVLSMPNPWWADYEAWKIWFEKIMPYLGNNVILVGHSLGGGFLLRYLSENSLPVTIAQLHLIAPVVTYLDDCEGFIIAEQNFAGLQGEIQQVHLWHSNDDEIVPITHSEQFLQMYPTAQLHRFTDRGHFLTESFPELEATIKSTL